MLYLLDRCWQWEKPEEETFGKGIIFLGSDFEKRRRGLSLFSSNKLDLAFYLGITPHLGVV